jgi:[acyl-carrier-protein] S-malonyltransferase
MAVVIGLGAEAVAALCAEAAAGDVLAPANLNGVGQVVVAGHARAVARLLPLATARKARAQLLAVSAPFHCALMGPAAAGLELHLGAIAFREPAVPVFTSVEARRVVAASELQRLLVRQVTAPVRWEETARAVLALGPTVALEVGPGRVLTGLLRRSAPTVTAVPAGDLEGIARARELLA